MMDFIIAHVNMKLLAIYTMLQNVAEVCIKSTRDALKVKGQMVKLQCCNNMNCCSKNDVWRQRRASACCVYQHHCVSVPSLRREATGASGTVVVQIYAVHLMLGGVPQVDMQPQSGSQVDTSQRGIPCDAADVVSMNYVFQCTCFK